MAIVSILGHRDISMFRAVTTVVANILISVFVDSAIVAIVVRVKEVVDIEFRAITSIALIVIVFIYGFPAFTFLSIFYFAKGVLASFPL
jgi:hypothetical protein